MRQQLGMVMFAAAFMAPVAASAYCRTTTCAQSNPPLECVPGEKVGSCQMSGKPLYWAKPCVSFSVQKDGSANSGITANQLENVIRSCYDNWQNSTCPEGGTPNIVVETYPQVDCRESRYNQSGGNQNVWLFRDGDWPHEGGGDGTIALTLVSFNRTTGEIYDVDVELNSYNRTFSLETSSVVGVDDLQSVVQHESGHFLGLAHSDIYDATMWANYSGSVDMRTLDADDIAGLCAINPPVAKKDPSCDAEPRHGFISQCAADDKSGCSSSCSVGSHSTSSHRAGLLALALGMLLVRQCVRKRG